MVVGRSQQYGDAHSFDSFHTQVPTCPVQCIRLGPLPDSHRLEARKHWPGETTSFGALLLKSWLLLFQSRGLEVPLAPLTPSPQHSLVTKPGQVCLPRSVKLIPLSGPLLLPTLGLASLPSMVLTASSLASLSPLGSLGDRPHLQT